MESGLFTLLLEKIVFDNCVDKLADFQAYSILKNYFQNKRYKKFCIVRGHAVAPRSNMQQKGLLLHSAQYTFPPVTHSQFTSVFDIISMGF